MSLRLSFFNINFDRENVTSQTFSLYHTTASPGSGHNIVVCVMLNVQFVHEACPSGHDTFHLPHTHINIYYRVYLTTIYIK